MDIDVQLHKPVLIDEVISQLSIRPEGKYIDCTFGRGGYSASILSLIGDKGQVVALDRDPDAISYGHQNFKDEQRLTLIKSDFAKIGTIAVTLGLVGLVDGVVADLGLSSPQVDNANRGFSFMRDGPLDMRMNPDEGMSAEQWLAKADETEIADVLWRYGDEKQSRRIAKAIKLCYPHNPITTTKQLADLVTTIVPFKGSSKKHPATCTFQAIRIFINEELKQLELLLQSLLGIVNIGGRIVIVSFHSLEDRIVKRFFRSLCVVSRLPKEIPVVNNLVVPNWKLYGKPIYASQAEVSANPRARSAVLRCIERVG